jgi:phosphodiester glycosidase
MRALGTTSTACVLCAAASAAASPTRTLSEDLHTGVHHEHWRDDNPAAEIELIKLDLTSQEIQVFATPPGKRGLTTSAFADALGVQIAINGDSFAINGPYLPRGLAIGNSTLWTNTHDDDQTSLFHFMRTADGQHEETTAEIITPEMVVTKADLPQGTEGAVGGKPLLVRDDLLETSFNCNDPVTVACTRAPRSAVGLSSTGGTMWLVVVDGWQDGSIGYTAAELASFIKARGAAMAMALDGGSSSTMVINGAVANHPSDGVERNVANHIGVKYVNLAKGELAGLVCKGDVIKCGQDDSLRIPSPNVVLDDGRTDAPANGYYSFTGITPRLACVTASKTGYKKKTQCHVVVPGALEYNSIQLDPVDGPSPDGGPTSSDPDAGTDPGPPPGGCCDSGRSGPFGGSGPIELALVCTGALRRRKKLRRARGTND